MEYVFIFLFNSLTAIEAKEAESIPPLRQNATGTSDLSLILSD